VGWGVKVSRIWILGGAAETVSYFSGSSVDCKSLIFEKGYFFEIISVNLINCHPCETYSLETKLTNRRNKSV